MNTRVIRVPIRVPMITSVKTAVLMYYERPYIGNKEIEVLFGKLGSSKKAQLKRAVLEKMAELGEMQYSANTVKTSTAYEVWGLDIAELEERLAKIKELKRR